MFYGLLLGSRPVTVTKQALITGSVARAVGGMPGRIVRPSENSGSSFHPEWPTAGTLIEKVPAPRGPTPARVF